MSIPSRAAIAAYIPTLLFVLSFIRGSVEWSYPQPPARHPRATSFSNGKLVPNPFTYEGQLPHGWLDHGHNSRRCPHADGHLDQPKRGIALPWRGLDRPAKRYHIITAAAGSAPAPRTHSLSSPGNYTLGRMMTSQQLRELSLKLRHQAQWLRERAETARQRSEALRKNSDRAAISGTADRVHSNSARTRQEER